VPRTQAREQIDLLPRDITALAGRDPKHAVGEVPANLRVPRERRRQNGLADSSPSMKPERPRIAGDAAER
jgi:hypothetical protein